MSDIKQEMANLIRSKPDDELLAMVLDREPASLVTKPVVSQKPRASKKPKNGSSVPNPGTPNDEVILKAISGLSGSSITELVGITGLGRSAVKRTVASLKRDEKVFQGGDRRFARYSTTQVEATRASELARTAGGK